MPERYEPHLEATSLVTSDIEYEVFTWSVPATNPPMRAGLIVFSGFYHPGSAGYEDGRFIYWRLYEFSRSWGIHGLVVDFRKLDYIWGNNLVIPHRDIPILVVIPSEADDPEHYKAFQWPVGEEILRTDIYEAFGEMNELIVTDTRK